MPDWIDPADVSVPEALQAAVGGHPLVAARLARLGLAGIAEAQAFLDPERYAPASPWSLPGMEKAVDRLQRATQAHEPICIWGDFDVDGQTATALLAETLQALGARVSYHIPLRETESHGVNLPALEKVIAGGAQLILTCDTGITAHEAVRFARARGVDFVITDHHELPEELPDALAIVNPKLLAAPHPLRDLPGVGCAYKLAEALCLAMDPWGAAAAEAGDTVNCGDLAALGIVADLAQLTGDTRYLLQRGLEALRRTERLGLKALFQTAGLEPEWLSEEHVGYVLAPRLNAAGRLADASAAVELLTTTDLTRARILASEMEGLNRQRKTMCDGVFAGAEAQIASNRRLLDDAALVLDSPTWPAGVIGIVASRLVERYGKPTVLIARPPGGPARGSARSIEGINITAAIAAHADLLVGFGGHPMAAGVTLDADRIPEFRRALCRTVAGLLGRNDVSARRLAIDGTVGLADLTPELADDLARLAPFGPGNRPLTLATPAVTVTAQRAVGRNDEHRLLTVTDQEGIERRVLWWDAAPAFPSGVIDLAYTVRTSNYLGQREVQIEWLDSRPHGAPEVALRPEEASIELVDHRTADEPRRVLSELAGDARRIVWREPPSPGAEGSDRSALRPSEELVLWTTPPGPAELRAAIARVQPRRIYLLYTVYFPVAVDPELDFPERFLARLAGLVKHALRDHSGSASLLALAGATAQREGTVQLGLEWLFLHGDITFRIDEAGTVHLGPALKAADAQTLAGIAGRLRAALAETASFRAYLRQAPVDALLRLVNSPAP